MAILEERDCKLGLGFVEVPFGAFTIEENEFLGYSGERESDGEDMELELLVFVLEMILFLVLGLCVGVCGVCVGERSARESEKKGHARDWRKGDTRRYCT